VTHVGPSNGGGQPSSNADDQAPSLTRGFLFADLRGYTGYVDEHGDHAGAQLLERYRVLVRAAVAASRGAEIKTEGDSFYVVFDSASAAVRCGLAIVAAAAETAPGAAETAPPAAEGSATPIEVGVGVHAGETVATAEGFVGSAVNIAARLCAQAKAGEVVVSETVRSLTRTYLDVDFVPLGTRRLKGVEEPVAIYRVAPRGTVAARARSRRAGGRRGWWLAGAGLIVLVAVLGVAGAAVLQGAGASPTTPPSEAPATTPPAGTTPSPGPAVSPSETPASAEQALLARVPSEFQPYCHRSDRESGGAGGDASLVCSLLPSSPGYGADLVWYDDFTPSGSGRMLVAVTDILNRVEPALVEGGADAVFEACASPGGKAEGRWSMGSTFSGRLACYSKDGQASVLWTYDGLNILARAVRENGDAEALSTWWEEHAAYYLR
jgi:class 3 adenylate cyclase